MRSLAFFVLGLLLLSPPAFADETAQLLSQAWPNPSASKLSEVGRGVGVVFSPDLSVPDNCHFYAALGFACFQDPDWTRVLDSIHRYNVLYPDRRIHTLVLETHGTNGNGLKLQTSYDPRADRSYIAVGALQERLARDGIDNIIVSACNSQRLLRPYIYNEIDPYNGDKLFLPATCGIVNASYDFDPARSVVTVITPRSSHIETTLVGAIGELARDTRQSLEAAARAVHVKLPPHFAVSDIMMQMITRDPRLELATDRVTDELSPAMQPVDRSEELYRRFLTYLNAVTAREKIFMRRAKATRPGVEGPTRSRARQGTTSRR